MATIKFLLQSKSNPSPIYIRLSLGRGKVLKRKSGFIIDPKFWSTATGYPKQNQEDTKQLKSKLVDLESEILKKYNLDYSTGVDISPSWLEESIALIQNREETNNQDRLVNYTLNFINDLPYNYNNNTGKKASKATITKYNTILKKLEGFEEHTNRSYKLKDVNLQFRSNLIEYLSQVDKINDNTIGRYLSFIKTIIYNARKNGYAVSPQIADFKGFSIKPPFVTLSFDEIEKIKAKHFTNKNLDAARDWLIVGCYVGQRVSDLLRINKKMIQSIEGFEFIVLKQVKTDKTVQIPIHDEVKQIMSKYKGQFPPTFANTIGSNSTMFNRLLKKVCYEVGLSEIVEGNLVNPETQRKETGKFEKWKLISSHVCRRSFATNFYSKRKYPTPLLMNITGHSTEKMFLNYIGKKPIDYSLQLAKLWGSN